MSVYVCGRRVASPFSLLIDKGDLLLSNMIYQFSIMVSAEESISLSVHSPLPPLLPPTHTPTHPLQET